MPGEAHYEGMTLAEKLRELADHHSDPDTRHMSDYERRFVLDAAERLEGDG